MVITLISQKGGVGKSTLAINLALAFSAIKGATVALVDCDEQESCLQALAKFPREKLNLVRVAKSPHLVIEKLKERVIVCDTAGRSHGTAWEAAAASDLVIIPVRPSPLDVLALKTTVAALAVVREKFNQGLRCRFLVNQATPRASISATIKEFLENHYPAVPVMETVLHSREAYKQSVMSGKSVIEHDKSSPAAKELGQLRVEITKIMKSKKGV